MPAPARRWFFAMLASLLWLQLLPSPTASTLPALDAPWFPATGAYLGAAVGRQPDATSPVCRDKEPAAGRSAFEGLSCVGRWSFIDHVYYRWDGKLSGEPWPTAYERSSRDQGRRLYINWIAKRANNTVVPWKDIAAGKHDAEIDAKARAVQEFGAPVYLTFHAEPEYNGTAGAFGNAAEFRAAWQRVVTRFRALNVTNVRWVLVLMSWTFDPRSGRDPQDFWPGDGYVDAVGVHGYNWLGCSGGGQKWTPFGTIFQRSYDWVAARNKPMVVAEWGSVEEPSDPDAKSAWIRETASWVKDHPNVKVMAYFHSHDVIPDRGRDCDWTLDSSPSTTTAFRDMVLDPYFNPHPPLPLG
jgi:hypothetical protein